jgi:hypothetical protein
VFSGKFWLVKMSRNFLRENTEKHPERGPKIFFSFWAFSYYFPWFLHQTARQSVVWVKFYDVLSGHLLPFAADGKKMFHAQLLLAAFELMTFWRGSTKAL